MECLRSGAAQDESYGDDWLRADHDWIDYRHRTTNLGLDHEEGGRFEVQNGAYYVCGTRRKSGKSVCRNPVSLRVDVIDEFILGLLDGEVLCATFIETVLNLACGNRKDDGRARLESERDDLSKTIARLVALVEAGTGEIYEVAAKLRKLTAERDTLNRRTNSMTQPPDRKALSRS